MQQPQKSNSVGIFSKSKKIGDVVSVKSVYGQVFNVEYLNQRPNVAGTIAKYMVGDGDLVQIGTILCYVEDGTQAAPLSV